MLKLSKLGLVFAGAYAALSLSAVGCAYFCTPGLGPHGNFYLAWVPWIPADLLLRRIGLGGVFEPPMSGAGFLFVALVTLVVSYTAGWLIEKLGVALFGAAKKSARAATPGPN